MSKLLIEDEVIKAVCDHLEKNGFRIKSVALKRKPGDDIIAISNDGSQKVYIEAKGATSSRKGSSRFGMPFKRGQVKSHIAMALYRASVMRENREENNIRVGIALPLNIDHKEMVGMVSKALNDLEIEIFWVDDKSNVFVVKN